MKSSRKLFCLFKVAVLSSLITLIKEFSELDLQIKTVEPKYRKSETALANTSNICMSTLTLALLFVDQVLKIFLLK